MASPSKDTLIALLREQIEAANNGNPSDLNEWKAQAGVVLRAAVGEGTRRRKIIRSEYESHKLPLQPAACEIN
jgi:hypothetical protein